MEEQMTIPYELATAPAQGCRGRPPRWSSPRAGILALARVYRALELPAAAESHLAGDAPVLEFQALAQTYGSDSILDHGIFAGDQVLQDGLGYAPPSPSSLRKFLNRLGQEAQTANAFQEVLAASVLKATQLWSAAWQQFAKRHPRQATIDLVQAGASGNGTISWQQPEGEFPCRLACLWREGDLVVSGGTCGAAEDVVALISQAFAAVSGLRPCTFFRAGPACNHPAILTWLNGQQTNLAPVCRTRRFRPGHRRQVNTRFMVGVRLDAPEVRALDKLVQGWTDCANTAVAGLQWLDTPPGGLPPAIARLGSLRFIRQPHPLRANSYLYAAFRTNKEGYGHELARWFSRGDAQLRRTAQDIALLAAGPHAQDDDSMAAGRFLVALLAYNLRAMIQALWVEGGAGPSLARFRAGTLTALGHVISHDNHRALALHDPTLYQLFQGLNEAFPAKSKVTIH